MVGVNLYKRKKGKLKITTFLLLCIILVLPVAAFRITLYSIREMEVNSIRAESPNASRYMSATQISDLRSASQQLDQQSSIMNQQIRTLQTASRDLERDALYQARIQGALEGFLDVVRSHTESRVYINALSIARGKELRIDFFETASDIEQYKPDSLENALKQRLQRFDVRIARTSSESLFYQGKYIQLNLPLTGM